jgi:hypothetical protein
MAILLLGIISRRYMRGPIYLDCQRSRSSEDEITNVQVSL